MTNHHPVYSLHLGETFQRAENNDCTVRALATVTGISYAEAHDDLKERGRRHGHRFEASILNRAIKDRGFTVLNITDKVKRKTTTVGGLEKLLKQQLNHHPIMAYVREHVLGAIEGQLADWTAGQRRHRLQRVYLVVPEGEEPRYPSLKGRDYKKQEFKRPSANSKSGKLWACLNRLNPDGPEYWLTWDADPEYLEFCATLNVSYSTAKTQFSQWKRWNK